MASRELGIALITFQHSVVVKGIENKLQGMGYHVYTVSDEFSKIGQIALTVSVIIVYLSSDVLSDPEMIKVVSLACDTAREVGDNMILIGDPGFKDDLTRVAPAIVGISWENRPLDMDKFMANVKHAIENPPNPASNKRILIVDDDPSYAKMIREWIKDSYRVDIVTAGMQAIKFLLKCKADEKVDLILLDYEMPVVDGPQVLQMLREEQETAGIPVVFLTGVGTKEAVARVMALKPDGYILKSTTRENLLIFLQDKLRRQ